MSLYDADDPSMHHRNDAKLPNCMIGTSGKILKFGKSSVDETGEFIPLM
jgi:hypothetical protein